ncbi:sugar transferase [Ruminococcus sp.]|jgi:O-antigen biosynthesis protein WbqP
MGFNWTKAFAVAGVSLGTAFVALNMVAKKKKPGSVYKNEPEQQNKMQGKKVVFVEDENDPLNADGFRGHLEAIGESEHFPTVYERYIKRAFDVSLSFCGLVALSPVFAATAIAIKLDDPGPILFTQKRVGMDKQYFTLHKFRSMKMCTPHDVPTHMLDDPDQYLLRVGKLIRKLSIDELPQIWDIFIGNMSIIGPRPALWNQDYLTSERDRYGANDIKPGLTGLAQIKGRDELEIPEKARLDGVYTDALKGDSITGLLMDIKVFLGSVSSVLRSEGIVEGGTGQMAKEFEKAENK